MKYTKGQFREEWLKDDCKITFDDCRESLSAWTGQRVTCATSPWNVCTRCLEACGMEKESKQYRKDWDI